MKAAWIFPFAVLGAASPAAADQLYDGGSFAHVASDHRAQRVGDIVSVVIYETASATNRVRNKSSKNTSIGGSIGAGSLDEVAELSLRGGYSGSGEVERSDRLVAMMTARIIEVLPNQDFIIEGRQEIFVNGERRNISIQGQVRQIDISSTNVVASSRIAGAKIDYDGKGFVSRSAKPGLLNRIFSFLGLA